MYEHLDPREIKNYYGDYGEEQNHDLSVFHFGYKLQFATPTF